MSIVVSRHYERRERRCRSKRKKEGEKNMIKKGGGREQGILFPRDVHNGLVPFSRTHMITFPHNSSIAQHAEGYTFKT